MSDFIGFFVRDNLGETPTQQGTSWSSCPDIIFQGLQAAPDPSQFLTPAGYAQDYGSTVYVQNPPVGNFVYLRAMNTNPAATASNPLTGRAWFYWVESDLALWPQNWNSGSVTVAGNPLNYQDITTTANNQVVMPNLPYIWSPPPPQSGSHYCCISWMEYPPSNPPQSPVSTIGYFQTWDQLTNFVLTHQNMGWRNTTDVAGQLTWSQTTNITGPATPSQFWVGVQCYNMPTDGLLGYSIPGPTPSIPAINQDLTKIQTPNWYTAAMINNWPGNAQSSITVNFQQGATTPQQGAYVAVQLMIPQSTMTEETFALAMQNPARTIIIPIEAFLLEEHRTDEVVLASTTVTVLGTQTFGF